MTDLAPVGDTARQELLRTAEEALARLAPDLPPAAARLLRLLHEGVPTPELAGMPAESVAAAAASLYALAQERPGGAPRIRILPPGPGPGEAGGPHAVAEIVTDDMPFLVDSALGALARQGRVVRQLLHPVVPVRRDAAGRLVALDPPDGGTAESMMRITLGAQPAAMLPGQARTAPDDWPALEAALARAMRDVRQAVADFPAMAETLRAAGHEVAAAPAGTEPGAAAFLRWLLEDNYVLLGHRRLSVSPEGEVSIVAAENLGLLRDADLPVFDVLRDPAHLPPAVRAALAEPTPVTVAKANMRSTVHRPQHADVVATRIYGPDGRVAGGRLFLGLFAAAAYNRNPRSIPMLAEKVGRILASAGHDPEAHDGRALRNILDTWPRDELFQAPEAAILAGARRALDLQVRPRAALVLREDPFGRFVSAIAWLPRDTFDTRLRERVGAMLARAYDGHLSAYYIAMGDAPLARVHYIIGTTPGRVPKVDAAVLEAAVAQAARSFPDRLAEALTAGRGEAGAAAALARWRDAFPAAYREGATGAQGVADLALAERALAEGRPAASLDRPPGAAGLVLRLANPGGPLPLADALPLFESLDLRAIEEVPHRLCPTEGGQVVLHVFTLSPAAEAQPTRFRALLDALSALLEGRAEADGFNRLVLRAGLDWRECWLLRAMYRWLKQVNFAFSQQAVEAALAAQPRAARLLLDLFHARFDPDGTRDEAALDAEWVALLDGVANPDEDRILSRLRRLLDAVLRTNYHLGKPWLSLKIDSAAAGEMPAPRPWREIFVHSPRMEGTHLRAGPVARGGIRWSDRREDYRTEILGLMKAQRVKNVVIVPTGAKGGFILKHPPPATDREAFMAEGIECYRTLVRGMLDITDNLVEGRVVPPLGVARRDGDDPYLVVAADKGTATFSDIANGLSAEYGFWLGDAFASGGSAGYDHKAMGITARGAWVMVARHFSEMGHDIFAQEFTCAGVGDMSGDVFGNGLLISRKTKLVAAFDHRHIFLDPDPDPEASYAERERLFALPRSSWADYNPEKISAGGGVFPRTLKTIPLSPQVRALLGIEAERAEPAQVMQAILTAKVDLLYFGGIGTYVKAGTESQAEAGDRANDAIRVNGADLRAKVVGEGANLAVTQAGRVEYARGGGRINTDALDNSAGVSTSDHEVNIKILLADAEAAGRLTRVQRDALLREMTDEVAQLVLRDNAQQHLAVTLEERAGAEALPAQALLMQRLEAAGVLDRSVAGLPDAATLRARIAAGEALTRPAICALLPLAKLWLTEAVEESDLPDDAAFGPVLAAYFPRPLQERFPELIARHRLRRELVATAIANEVANRLGCAGLARLAAEAGPVAAARAAWLAGEGFGIPAAADAADAAAAPAGPKLEVLLALRRLQQEAAQALLGGSGPIGPAIGTLRPGLAALAATAPEAAAAEAWQAAGLPERAVALAAAAPRLAAAPIILRLAAETGAAPEAAAAAWAEVGARFRIEALRQAAAAAPAPGAFGPRARAALLEDLGQAQGGLAVAQLRGAVPDAAEVAALAQEAAQAGDLAAIGVAARALRGLA
ncbi:NAD-glutamate dehydrogenase [Paracraurococcus lichenis]|uniref:NAD-glutamate dehydrogenase n=1 Tax=Paracraurococcus lichenis TaxID=3064888 RepID=A0ABT9E647_9PROT|nr:NAD-glutamate dehydrogenase domain-containing protein [Paracraurococcus sp. LOR1-02]MDO9711655.1 NAD-glutamate dehydrogenase [Paracraurococcus sp. LOR1-02]